MADSYTDVLKKVNEVRPQGLEAMRSVAQQAGWSLEEIRDAAKARPAALMGAPLVQGATGGTGDEITAFLHSITGGESYEKELGTERAILKRARSEYPKTSFATEVAGAVLPGIATSPLSAGRTLASTLGRSAGVGAGEGAIYGAGTGETPGERIAGAGFGAAGGAVGGVVAPALLEAGTAAIRPGTAAVSELRRALVRDETTPQALAAKAAQLQAERPAHYPGAGPTMLLDAGGENVKGLAERIAQTPGAGRTLLRPKIEQRQITQQFRLTADLAELTGTQKTAMQALEETKLQREQAATPLYQQAYAHPLGQAEAPIAGKFAEVLKTPLGQKAWKGAQDLLLSDPAFRNTPVDQLPLTVKVDYWQRAANDLLETAAGTNRNRIVTGMMREVVTPLEQANPSYELARGIWAGSKQYDEAVAQGRRILNDKFSAEEMTAMFQTMSAAEREGFRIGAASSITAKIGNKDFTVGDFTKGFGSAETKAKISMLMPTPEAAQKWLQRFEIEQDISKTGARLLGGPATARRLAEQGEGDMTGFGLDVVRQSLGGTTFYELLKNMAGKVATKGRDTLRSKADKRLIEILTTNQAPPQSVLPPLPGVGSGAAVGVGAQGGAGLANTMLLPPLERPY